MPVVHFSAVAKIEGSKVKYISVAGFLLMLGACSTGEQVDKDSDVNAPSLLVGGIVSDLMSAGEPCQPQAGEAPDNLFITLDCFDPEFTQPYIDVDEWRTTRDGNVEVTYRYVHGGFKESSAKFAYYFPAAVDYRGRFFQSTYPTVGTEGAVDGHLAFAIENGAYLVSSNNGGGVMASPRTSGYRVNAAAAKFSQAVAAKLYGHQAPTRGYIFGISGGALQTWGAIEQTRDIWSGAVPIVPGAPNSMPSFQAVHALVLRELKDKLPEIAAVFEPGGSRDPYEVLDSAEKAILAEAELMGFPPRGLWQWETADGGSFYQIAPTLLAVDPTYFEDFYSKPGYAGYEDPSVKAARVQFDTTVIAVGDNGIELEEAPSGYLDFVNLSIHDGAAAGRVILNVDVDATIVSFPPSANQDVTASIAVGDSVRVDNSMWIATQYYQRHQVPGPDQIGWNQFRDSNGQPKYVQRDVLTGELLFGTFGGIPQGKFDGKMIMIGSVMDVEAYPWTLDWYANTASQATGDRLVDQFRLWYLDNADHIPYRSQKGEGYIIDYRGIVQQALLYLDDWVANGKLPPDSTGYKITDRNQVALASDPVARAGVQPLVSLNVLAGGECMVSRPSDTVSVARGQPVSLVVEAVVPAGAGDVISFEWDFDNSGKFPEMVGLDVPSSSASSCIKHQYDEPGTYYAVVRVTAQRAADQGGSFGRATNLARVRIQVD